MKAVRIGAFAGSFAGLIGIFVFTLSVVVAPLANAAMWDGRAMYTGYFDGNYGDNSTPYAGGGHPVFPNSNYANNAIPASVNSTGALYTFLYDKYYHTGPYGGSDSGGGMGLPLAQRTDQTGAAFVVNTMLGRSGPQANRNLGPADWADLQRRLSNVTFEYDQAANTNWVAEGGLCRDTYAQYDRNDVTYDNECGQTGRAISLIYQGVRVYMIFYSCGNPVGNLSGLPDVNFNLNPGVSLSSNAAAEAGSAVSVTATVKNTGTTLSTPASWQLTTFTVPPAPAALPGGGLDVAAPQAHYGHAATIIAQGAGVSFPGNNIVTRVGLVPQNLPDVPVGSRVCYELSVSPYSQSDTRWNNTTPDSTNCIVIAKKPKVQVRSGDLEVGRGSATTPAATSNIITSTTNKSGTTYGSWAEYGIIPSGTVTGMASGAGYAGGTAATSMCSLSVLTFTAGSTGGNSCGATIGKYVQTSIAPNVSARFPINVSSDVATPGNPASPAALPRTTVNIVSDNLSGLYQAPAGATALTITGGNSVPAGRWVVINAPNATVTITGDITYTNAQLHALADIPQVVIIAKNIIVADNVTQIDSWLVTVGAGTEGRLNTCGAGAVTETSALTYKDCDKKLTVNGPVIANHLILRRTAGAGSGAQSGDPAEVFNLRPDAYIWATTYNQNSGRLATVATKELPPRF